jgi:hypothetical protein
LVGDVLQTGALHAPLQKQLASHLLDTLSSV